MGGGGGGKRYSKGVSFSESIGNLLVVIHI